MLNRETEVLLMLQKLLKIYESLAAWKDQHDLQINAINLEQSSNTYRIEVLERQNKTWQSKLQEFEYQPNWYSLDGESNCNYSTNLLDKDEENYFDR